MILHMAETVKCIDLPGQPKGNLILTFGSAIATLSRLLRVSAALAQSTDAHIMPTKMEVSARNACLLLCTLLIRCNLLEYHLPNDEVGASAGDGLEAKCLLNSFCR
jgi:hypothetical protein